MMFHVSSFYTSDIREAYKYAWLLSQYLSQDIIIYDDNGIFERINAAIDHYPMGEQS